MTYVYLGSVVQGRRYLGNGKSKVAGISQRQKDILFLLDRHGEPDEDFLDLVHKFVFSFQGGRRTLVDGLTNSYPGFQGVVLPSELDPIVAVAIGSCFLRYGVPVGWYTWKRSFPFPFMVFEDDHSWTVFDPESRGHFEGKTRRDVRVREMKERWSEKDAPFWRGEGMDPGLEGLPRVSTIPSADKFLHGDRVVYHDMVLRCVHPLEERSKK